MNLIDKRKGDGKGGAVSVESGKRFNGGGGSGHKGSLKNVGEMMQLDELHPPIRIE
jgi:hypothetical protein